MSAPCSTPNVDTVNQPLAMKRSALACLPCRTAKNKCDGDPPPIIVELSSSLETKAVQIDDVQSSHPCTRCQRLRLVCSWQPSHRTGRPRKRRKQQNQMDDSGSTVSVAQTSASQEVSPSSPSMRALAEHDQNIQAAQRPSVLQTSSHLEFSREDLIALLNSSPFDSTQAANAVADDPNRPNSSLSIMSAIWSQAEDVSDILQEKPSCLETTYDLDLVAADPLSMTSQAHSPSQTMTHISALRARLGTNSGVTTPMDLPHEQHADPALRSKYYFHTDDVSIPPDMLDHGCELFFHGFAKTVPILGEKEDYRMLVLEVLPPHSLGKRLLSAVVAALGFLLTEGPASEPLRRLRAEARAISFQITSSYEMIRIDDLCEILSTIQALVLLAYDDYGQNSLRDAERDMQAAAHLALKIGLNELDKPGSHIAAQIQDLSHNGQRGAESGQMAITDRLQEACRRTWWELYLCDTMLQVTTSKQVKRMLDAQTMIVAVHAPLDVGPGKRDGFPERQPRSARSEAYDIRVRATAMILECTTPPKDPQRPDLARLRAVDTIISNLLVRAQTIWANTVSVISADKRLSPIDSPPAISPASSLSSSDKRTDRERWASETKAEILFTGMVLLYAARIHLHRQAWFTDLTMDFESCSFKPHPSSLVKAAGSDQAASQPTSPGSPLRDAAQRQMLLATSVTKIISSADSILRLVRLDQRAQLESSLASLFQNTVYDMGGQQGTVPAHWPFYGCCNMVASFGYVIAVAASGPSQSNLPSYGDEFRLFEDEGALAGLSPDANAFHDVTRISCMQQETDWQVSKQEASSNQTLVWKLRAALSNIGFAETTLSQYATVWPIASVYQDEVARCRQAIDFAGPTGLGSPNL